MWNIKKIKLIKFYVQKEEVLFISTCLAMNHIEFHPLATQVLHQETARYCSSSASVLSQYCIRSLTVQDRLCTVAVSRAICTVAIMQVYCKAILYSIQKHYCFNT